MREADLCSPAGPAHREVWLREPTGYSVVIACPDGEAADV
jgi:hypothetical protein